MFINHKNKDLFIHIPKTGGTSITKCYLDKYPNNTFLNRIDESQKKSDINGHIFIKDLASMIDISEYNSFAVIRNPFELVVSHYFFSIQHPKYNYNDTFENFISLMTNPNAVRNPMVDYISDDNGNILVKNILRYETLDKEFLDLTGISLSNYNFNKSSHGHYSEYYSEETKEIISNYFKQDLEIFGYSF